jgi:hypothetical protein
MAEESQIDSRQWQEIFFLNSIQTGFGARSAFHTMGTGGSFP